MFEAYLRVWQQPEVNGKPEEIDKDGYHDQTQHTSHKLLTNLKLKWKTNEMITVVSQI